MSETRCPNCDVLLSRSEIADGRCDGCGAWLPQREPSRRDRPPPPPLKAPRLVPFLALLGIGGLIAGVVLFFVFRPDVEVYVDNGGSEPVTVYLDGTETLTVPPGKVDYFSCRSGSRLITVKRGDRTVFEATKELESARRGKRKYLLNPESTNRYWERTVNYGLSLPSFSFYIDEADRYRKTAERIKRVPVTDWIDVQPDHVLEPAPKQVEGNVLASRKVLTRLTRADYQLLEAAETKKVINPGDQETLEKLVERLLNEDL